MVSDNTKTTTKEIAIKDLTRIPGVGKSLATDLWNIGITSVSELKSKDPEILYDLSNQYVGALMYTMFSVAPCTTQILRRPNELPKN